MYSPDAATGWYHQTYSNGFAFLKITRDGIITGYEPNEDPCSTDCYEGHECFDDHRTTAQIIAFPGNVTPLPTLAEMLADGSLFEPHKRPRHLEVV